MHSGTPGEQFVSEAITPKPGSFDAMGMARGEAGVPAEFTWRGTRYVVARVTAAWKSSTAERGEMYLRRHWYAVQTLGGEHMTIYCERQARNTKRPTRRWWLYSWSPKPDKQDGATPITPTTSPTCTGSPSSPPSNQSR